MKDLKEELLQVDIDFSALSKANGMNYAFLVYAHPDAVFLRDKAYPLVGKNKIRELFESRGDSGYTLTWSPLYADVASSGELGYSYGIYEMKSGDEISKGTYVSVWKKDKKGQWRWVLDSGNEGLGE
ncbi:MAG: hypothetical protein ACEPOZ_13205 [Marinifilaceae bacterium]